MGNCVSHGISDVGGGQAAETQDMEYVCLERGVYFRMLSPDMRAECVCCWLPSLFYQHAVNNLD